jgi:hypothetical protein
MRRKRWNKASLHTTKSRIERENYARAVHRTGEDPTIVGGDALSGTLSDVNKIGAEMPVAASVPARKSIKNRLALHLIDHWPNYLLALLMTIAGFCVVTANVKLAEINKDLSYQSRAIETNAARIGSVDKRLETISEKVSSLQSVIQSLDDRFTLIIEVFRQSKEVAR